ncbi:hypothetical protein ACVWZL_007365 [Bradyrhizobium sp. GM2.4]
MKNSVLAIGILSLPLLHSAFLLGGAGAEAQQLYLTAPTTPAMLFGAPSCPNKQDVVVGTSCSRPKTIEKDPALLGAVNTLNEQINKLQNNVSALENNLKTLSGSTDALTKRFEVLEQQDSSSDK